MDLGFRLSVLGPRLSALGFRFSALVFRLLALGSGFQPFSGDWLSLSEKKGFLLFQDDFDEERCNIQVSSCHSLASLLTVGKYLDLGFRCSAFASRLSDFWDFVDFLGLLGFQ